MEIKAKATKKTMVKEGSYMMMTIRMTITSAVLPVRPVYDDSDD